MTNRKYFPPIKWESMSTGTVHIQAASEGITFAQMRCGRALVKHTYSDIGFAPTDKAATCGTCQRSLRSYEFRCAK